MFHLPQTGLRELRRLGFSRKSRWGPPVGVEEIRAGEYPVAADLGGSDCPGAGSDGVAKAAEAGAALGGQFGLVEVGDPRGVVAGVGAGEGLLDGRQGGVTGGGVFAAGGPAGTCRVELRGHRPRGHPFRADDGAPGEAGGLAE